MVKKGFLKKKLSSEDLDRIIEAVDEELNKELRSDRVIATANLVVSLEYNEERGELNANVMVEIGQRVKGVGGPEARVDKLINLIRRALEDALVGVEGKAGESSRGVSKEEGSGDSNS